SRPPDCSWPWSAAEFVVPHAGCGIRLVPDVLRVGRYHDQSIPEGNRRGEPCWAARQWRTRQCETATRRTRVPLPPLPERRRPAIRDFSRQSKADEVLRRQSRGTL